MKYTHSQLSNGFWLEQWFIDPLHGRFETNGHQMHIEPKVMDVLVCLAESHGSVVSRDQLLREVWAGVVVSEEVLTRCISELRTALNDTHRERRFIKTIPKRGYSLIITPTLHSSPESFKRAPTRADQAGSPEAMAGAADTDATTRNTAKTGHQNPSDLPPQQNDTLETSPAEHKHLSAPLAIAFAVLVGLVTLALFLQNQPSRAPEPDLVEASLAQQPGAAVPDTYALDVAVLPFANLTGDIAHDYIGNGLAEDVRSKLISSSGMRVAARTSSDALSDRGLDVRDIGDSLSARHVVEGTIRVSNGRLRVTAQLSTSNDGRSIWANTFDGDMNNVFALLDEISDQIAAVLADQQTSSGQTNQVAAIIAPASSVAYDNYLLGRFYWNKRTLDTITRAQSYFRTAIEQDSNFSPAYAGLADSIMLGFTYAKEGKAGATLEEKTQVLAEAESLIDQALAINPSDYEAHASKGLLASIRGEHANSIYHYRQSVEINPEYSMARMWYGSALMKFGRVNESYEQYDIALSRDPLHPAVQVNYLSSLMQMGKYDHVINKSDEFYGSTKNPSLVKMQLLARLHLGDFSNLFAAAKRFQFYGENLSHAGYTILVALMYLDEFDRVNDYLARIDPNDTHMVIDLRVKAAVAQGDNRSLKQIMTEVAGYIGQPDISACDLGFYHKYSGMAAWLDGDNQAADNHFARAAEIYDLECTVDIKSFAETLAYRIDIAKKSERPESLTQLLAMGLEAIDDASNYGRADMDVEIAKLILMVAAQETDTAHDQMYAMQAKGWLPQASTKFSPILDEFTLQFTQSTALNQEFHRRTQQAYNVAKEQSRALDLAAFDI